MKARIWLEVEVGDHHTLEKVASALSKGVRLLAQHLNKKVGPATIAVAIQPLTDNAELLMAGMDLPKLLNVTNEVPEATNDET